MPEKVTEAQASEALGQMIQEHRPDEESALEIVEHEVPKEEAPKEDAAAEPSSELAEEEAPEDDVASLRKRLEQREAEIKSREEEFTKQRQAFSSRAAENERILRERVLRKSTVADRALKILEAARKGEADVDEADRVIQEIRASMNPASPSYVPPQASQGYAEEPLMVLNSFLNEKGMSQDQQDKFGTWIQTEAPRMLTAREQAVAQESIDGFLRIAHARWQESANAQEQTKKHAETVAAVKTVQRAQKASARAASAPTSAPRKTSAGPSGDQDPVKQLRKLPREEQQQAVAELVKLSIDQHR